MSTDRAPAGAAGLDWQALADAVRERRYKLGLSQEALVEHGGPSHQIVRNLESGKPGTYRPDTLFKLERALRWPRGHAQRVLDGTAPADGDAALDWRALADAVKARRTALRLPQDLMAFGGPSEFTVRRVERAEVDVIRPKTMSQIEAALQWPRGTVDELLRGERDPEDVVGIPTPPPTAVSAIHAAADEDARALRVGKLVLALMRELR